MLNADSLLSVAYLDVFYMLYFAEYHTRNFSIIFKYNILGCFKKNR